MNIDKKVRTVLKINVMSFMISSIICGVVTEQVIHTSEIVFCGICLCWIEAIESTRRAFWIYMSAIFVNSFAMMSNGYSIVESLIGCGVELQAGLISVLIVDGILTKIKFGDSIRRESRMIKTIIVVLTVVTILGSYWVACTEVGLSIESLIAAIQVMLPALIVMLLYMSSEMSIVYMSVYGVLYIYTIVSSIKGYTGYLVVEHMINLFNILFISGYNIYTLYFRHHNDTVGIKMVDTINEKIRNFC